MKAKRNTRTKKETTKPYSLRLTTKEHSLLKSLAKQKTKGNMAELFRLALIDFKRA